MGNEGDAEHQADALLTGVEVARIFRVSARTVGRWGRSGLLPLYRTPGGDHRYRLSDVTAFLERQAQAADA
jgi:excisionase family DNA binding protein